MGRRRIRCSALVAFFICSALQCVAFVLASAANAQPSDDPTRDASARALFQEGVELAEASDWRGAEDRFRRAYTLRASPVIAYNLASALAERGKFVEASEFVRKVTQDDKADAGLKQSARALQAQLAERIGRVTISVREKLASDRVLLDANPLLDAQLGVEIPIDPGTHSVSLQRGDEEVDVQTVRVTPGGVDRVTLIAPPVPSPEQVAVAAEVPGPARKPGFVAASERADVSTTPVTARWWFWTGLGVVAVGAITAAVIATSSGQVQAEAPFKGDFAPGSINVRVGP